MPPSERRTRVTGGAGFLGSRFGDALILRGDEGLWVENFHTDTSDDISPHLAHPCLELLRHDITLPLDVDVDRIFNLACPGPSLHFQHDPVRTTRTWDHGAMDMLELAERNRARIVQSSSIEVYGDPEVHPQPDSDWARVNPIGERSCYNEGKRCVETLFFDYHQQ